MYGAIYKKKYSWFVAVENEILHILGGIWNGYLTFVKYIEIWDDFHDSFICTKIKETKQIFLEKLS